MQRKLPLICEALAAHINNELSGSPSHVNRPEATATVRLGRELNDYFVVHVGLPKGGRELDHQGLLDAVGVKGTQVRPSQWSANSVDLLIPKRPPEHSREELAKTSRRRWLLLKLVWTFAIACVACYLAKCVGRPPEAQLSDNQAWVLNLMEQTLPNMGA